VLPLKGEGRRSLRRNGLYWGASGVAVKKIPRGKRRMPNGVKIQEKEGADREGGQGTKTIVAKTPR